MKTVQMKKEDFNSIRIRDSNNKGWVIVSAFGAVVLFICSLIMGYVTKSVTVDIGQIFFGICIGFSIISLVNHKVHDPIIKRTKKLNKKKKPKEPEIVKNQEQQ